MQCPICNEEVRADDQAERWGPEFAHTTCVTAYNAGVATERDRWMEASGAVSAGVQAADLPGVQLVTQIRLLALGSKPADALGGAGQHRENPKTTEPTDGASETEFDACRAAFIAMMKKKDEYRPNGSKTSLRANWAGKQAGFAEPRVQANWQDFRAGWLAARS